MSIDDVIDAMGRYTEPIATDSESYASLRNFGLLITVPHPPNPPPELVEKFTRLYGPETGRRTAAAIVAWRDRPRREAEFRARNLAALDDG